MHQPTTSQLEPKHYRWAAGTSAVATFVVVNVLSTELGFGPLLPGLIAGVLVFMFYGEIVGRLRRGLDRPLPQAFSLSRRTVLGVLKEVVPNLNVEDKWWTLHWMNQEKGQMKFRVNYEVATGYRNEIGKQQIVLDTFLDELPDGRTSVRLQFTVSPQRNREHADQLIKHTTESIWYQLEATARGKQ